MKTYKEFTKDELEREIKMYRLKIKDSYKEIEILKALYEKIN